MSGEAATRILVADNDARVRSALRHLLKQEPGQLVIRDSADLGGLAAQVREFQPDLVLLDWELPGRPAAALLFALHGLERHPQVIVLSSRAEAEREALAMGADGFVSKGEPPERLLTIFRSLVREIREDSEREVPAA